MCVASSYDIEFHLTCYMQNKHYIYAIYKVEVAAGSSEEKEDKNDNNNTGR